MKKIIAPVPRTWLFRFLALVIFLLVSLVCLQINNSKRNPENIKEKFTSTNEELNLTQKIRLLTGCRDKDFAPRILQHGSYTVLRNYIRAEHGAIGCGDSVTYVSHGDFRFLDNLIAVIERWKSPLSIALMGAGTDFQLTIKSIFYLRNCVPKSDLVRKFATFHIFFTSGHSPKEITSFEGILNTKYKCEKNPPFKVAANRLYKTKHKLSYPINVGRNIAREAALTQYVFVSDIELYPSPGVPQKFLEMIARNDSYFRRPNPKVYPFPIFEISDKLSVPMTKTELQQRFKTKDVIIFHSTICEHCHEVPEFSRWIEEAETDALNVFTVAKRVGNFSHWEPIFIGTNDDPDYDERLSYDEAFDKMPQAYAMCSLNYEFHVLDNAFLVHRPGIKQKSDTKYRKAGEERRRNIINKQIAPELRAFYGKRHDECLLWFTK